MDDIPVHFYPVEFTDLKFYCIPDSKNVRGAFWFWCYSEPIPDGAITSNCDPPNPMCEQVHVNITFRQKNPSSDSFWFLQKE